MSTLAPVQNSTETELTDEEILQRLEQDVSLEYVNGRFVEKGMGSKSSAIGMRVAWVLHVLIQRGFEIFDQSLIYECFPNSAKSRRRPDASVIRVSRLIEANMRDVGVMTIPADLAVEVVSPGDTVSDLQQKIVDFREAGFGQVWVLYPEIRVVEVHAADGGVTRLSEADTLEAGDVLDGFTCSVADFFVEAK